MVLTRKQLYTGGAVAAGLLLAWIYTKGVRNAAQSAARAAVGLAEGTATGIVVGIGEGIGIPPTDYDQCTADLANGRTWDASFSCPAGTFLKSFFD